MIWHLDFLYISKCSILQTLSWHKLLNFKNVPLAKLQIAEKHIQAKPPKIMWTSSIFEIVMFARLLHHACLCDFRLMFALCTSFPRYICDVMHVSFLPYILPQNVEV